MKVAASLLPSLTPTSRGTMRAGASPPGLPLLLLGLLLPPELLLLPLPPAELAACSCRQRRWAATLCCRQAKVGGRGSQAMTRPCQSAGGPIGRAGGAG